jgi:hypothetical protein
MVRLILLVASLLWPAAASATPEIRWRVANPFRLFTDERDTNAHRMAYEAWLALSQEDRQRLEAEGKGPISYAEIGYFAARHSPGSTQLEYLRVLKATPNDPYRGWAEAVVGPNHNKTCFDWATQEYTACEEGGPRAQEFNGGSYVHPRSHRIEARVEGSDVPSGDCVWEWKPQGPAQAWQQSGPAGACAAWHSLDVPYPAGAIVSVRAAGSAKQGPSLAEASIQVRDVLIVGLGDSFGSGEGNPDYPVRLAKDYYNNYEAYLSTYDGDATDWCLARARGNSSVDRVSCSDSGTHYPLRGYPTRAGTGTNNDPEGFYDTDQAYFDTASFRSKASVWLSRACHRSLYSHQARVALQLSLEDEHRAVTFLGYACSGAEMLGGLLLPEKFFLQRETEPGMRMRVSQLSALSRDLCRTSATASSALPVKLAEKLGASFGASLVAPTKSSTSHSAADLAKAQASICEAGRRQVDLVLMSFGGNDVGFVPLVGHIIAGHDTLVKQWAEKVFDVIYGMKEARRRTGMVGDRYAAAAIALKQFLGITGEEGARVLLTAYPPLANDEEGAICKGGFFAGDKDAGLEPPLRAVNPAALGMDIHPLFRFNAAEAQSIQSFLEGTSDQGLYGVMQTSARSQGWTFVDSHARGRAGAPGPFARHGVCATGAVHSSREVMIAETMALPRCIRGRNGQCTAGGWTWAPFDPDQFSPYVSRQRWYRTLNDAFLTEHFHTAPGTPFVNKNDSWRLAAAAAYGGAFHPTAEGQAAIADAVLLRARCVLRKFGAVSSQGPAQADLYRHCP